MASRRNIINSLLFGCVGLLMSAAVVKFDFDNGSEFVHQLGADSFLPTQGTVIRSATSRKRAGRGTTTVVDILYTFNVNGRTYTGNIYRYMNDDSSEGWAETVVAKYPRGTPVTVYYNPTSPGDALLVRGFDGCDLIRLLWIVPFNLMICFFWYGCGRSLLEKLTGRRRPNFKTIQTGSLARVRIPDEKLFLRFFLALFTVLALEPILLRSHPTIADALTVWLIVLVLMSVIFVFHTWRIHSGAQDVLIDAEKHELTLPKTSGRKMRVALPFAAISEVGVDAEEYKIKRRVETRFAVVIRWTQLDGQNRTDKVIEGYPQVESEAFAQWLREQTGMEAKSGVQDPTTSA